MYLFSYSLHLTTYNFFVPLIEGHEQRRVENKINMAICWRFRKLNLDKKMKLTIKIKFDDSILSFDDYFISFRKFNLDKG